MLQFLFLPGAKESIVRWDENKPAVYLSSSSIYFANKHNSKIHNRNANGGSPEKAESIKLAPILYRVLTSSSTHTSHITTKHTEPNQTKSQVSITSCKLTKKQWMKCWAGELETVTYNILLLYLLQNNT